MPLNDAYATVEDYQAKAGRLNGANAQDIEADLAAFSRLIDLEAGRNFNQTALVARTFYPGLGRSVEVGDIATTAGLAVLVDVSGSGSFVGLTPWTIETDFVLAPYDAAERGWPYSRLEIPGWSGQSRFADNARVQITAVWGWPAVPRAIKQLCIELARTWRFEGPRGTNRFTDMGELLATTREARSLPERLLSTYKRAPVVVA